MLFKILFSLLTLIRFSLFGDFFTLKGVSGNNDTAYFYRDAGRLSPGQAHEANDKQYNLQIIEGEQNEIIVKISLQSTPKEPFEMLLEFHPLLTEEMQSHQIIITRQQALPLHNFEDQINNEYILFNFHRNIVEKRQQSVHDNYFTFPSMDQNNPKKLKNIRVIVCDIKIKTIQIYLLTQAFYNHTFPIQEFCSLQLESLNISVNPNKYYLISYPSPQLSNIRNLGNNCPTGCTCQGNSCNGCIDGYYYNYGGGGYGNNRRVLGNGNSNNNYVSCSKCDNTCLKCQGSSSNCTQCPQGSILTNNNTCQKCDPSQGYYSSGGQCLKCDSNCKLCMSKSTTCTACQDPMIISQSQTCVNCNTANGFFITPTKVCTMCNSTCLTCNGDKDNNCLTCPSTSSLQSGKCVTCDTSNGYFINTTTQACQKCDPACKTCTGTKSNNCTSCQQSNNYLRPDNTCQLCDTTNGYFVDSSNICQKCDTTCKSCNGKLNNNCTACPVTTYLKTDGTCSPCTDPGFYQDKTFQKCVSCNITCQTCSGSSANACLTCISGKFLFSDNSCNTCPPPSTNGYFQDNTNPSKPLCTACFTTCLSCTDANQNSCTACQSSLLRINPTAGSSTFSCGTCDTNAGKYSVPNGAFQDCLSCDATCEKCTDSQATSCTKCVTGKYFISGAGGSKTCGDCQTNNGFYVDTNGYCQPCNPSCKQCLGTDTTCTACQNGSYLNTDTKTCGSCGAGTYPNQNVCSKCDTTCLTCNGGGINNCLSCGGTNGLMNNACSPCQDGTYLDSNICKPCDPSCKTCTVAISCATCPSGKFIITGSNFCQDCPQNYLNSGTACTPCDSTCLTCSGTIANCDSCPGSIQLISNTCPNNNCNPNQVYINGACTNCDTSCNTCNNSDQYSCIQCASNKSFKTNESNQKECVDCSTQPQFVQVGNNCLPCDPSCQTCSTPSNPNKCLSCLSGPHFLKIDDSSCSDCKMDGYYQSGTSCLKCPPNCQKCSLEASVVICSQCEANYTRDLTKQQCISCDTTNAAQFISTDQICKQCDSSCKTCNEATSNNCNSCYQGYNLLNNSQCIVCGNGYFIDGSGMCGTCPTDCQQCDNSTSCKICQPSKYLNSNNLCVSSCNTDEFGYNDGVLKCGKCDLNCATCDSATKCKTCTASYHLILQADNVSVKCNTCNSNQYLDTNDQFCKACDPSCATCDGPFTNNCITCVSNLYLYNKTCTNCSGNFQILAPNCVKCDDKCDGCDSNGCTKCASGYYFQGVSKSCDICNIQNGYFIQSSNNSCQKCDPNCQTCSGSTPQSCILCAGDLSKDQSGNCIKCDTNNGNFEDKTNKLCLPCAQNCMKCDGPSISQCTQCISGLYIAEYTAGNIECADCTVNDGYFINGNKCTKCDSSCKTCNGATSSECLTCFSNYFIIGNNRSCVLCPNSDYDSLQGGGSVRNCLVYDITCQNNFDTGSYSLVVKCTECKTGYTLQVDPNLCITDCSNVGSNMIFNNVSKQCVCPSSYYQNIPKRKHKQYQPVFCTSDPFDGFLCNAQRICYECNDNCQVCKTKTDCKVCISTHYEWLGECFENCDTDKGITINTSINDSKSAQNVCVCKSGYVLRIQDKICVLKLKITTVTLSIKNNFNLLTVILNRIPYRDELSDLKLLIDPEKIHLNTDYQIVSTDVVDNTIQFLINVAQNRRINQIQITLNKENNLLNLSNTILTTEDFNKNNKASQERSQSINNASQALIPENTQAKNIMYILKNFQILIIMSNFIQVLGPIVMLKESLPPQIYTYSILGASFIFEHIPSYQELNYEISTTTDQKQYEKQQTSSDSGNEYPSSKFRILHELGLEKPLYSNFLFPHLSLAISSIIVGMNLFARAIMRGKQYTLVIVNLIMNTMSNLNQGYITPTVFSIYFSISFSESRPLAIFQAFIHGLFLSLMFYVLTKKDTKYIEEHIPNFLENINFKAKGSRSYIILSYVKKYFVIAMFLSTSQNAVTSCALIASAFFLHGFYISVYRFFQFTFITYYKIFQEFFIGTTFVILAVACKNLDSVLSSTTISNGDLYGLEKISLVVFYMLMICLAMSLILFLVRIIISLQLLIKKIKEYLRQKQIKEDQSKNLLLIQELAESSSLSNSVTFVAKNKLSPYRFVKLPQQNNSPNITSGSEDKT